MNIDEKGIRPLVIKVNTLDTFFMQRQNVLWTGYICKIS